MATKQKPPDVASKKNKIQLFQSLTRSFVIERLCRYLQRLLDKKTRVEHIFQAQPSAEYYFRTCRMEKLKHGKFDCFRNYLPKNVYSIPKVM